MKFMIMIYSNPEFRAVWESLSEEQQVQFGRDHLAVSADMAETGDLVAAEGLADPAMSRTVSTRGGLLTITDGPYSEIKEQVVGFCLVDCDNIERAIEYAARIPDAAFGAVEVRPVANLSYLET
ncbi:YciI family protein [Paenarthrobacter sp. PH39-S1]|uniref:YciI family protein n=1 Tax=Paenarthrobacter sp. PH39-S1 TaxID=3046204 RepID=UPI0024B8B0EF|nr:YciI family protein [Paenarthrobacter sp. PH39-S1]MDJ0356658.1 YciI family protein [Paenarthrobacter sp. PH39-S1]